MSLVAYNTLCELVLTPRTPRCLRVARLTPGHVCWAAALQAYHEVFMSFSLWKLGHGCHLRIKRREKESRERRSRTFRSYSTGSPPVRCLLGHVTDLGLHMPHYPERCICRQNLRPRSGILMTPPPPPPPPFSLTVKRRTVDQRALLFHSVLEKPLQSRGESLWDGSLGNWVEPFALVR